MAESAEGGTLLRCYMEQSVSRVRIPASPSFKQAGESPLVLCNCIGKHDLVCTGNVIYLGKLAR